jgi:hypothetical protein
MCTIYNMASVLILCIIHCVVMTLLTLVVSEIAIETANWAGEHGITMPMAPGG